MSLTFTSDTASTSSAPALVIPEVTSDVSILFESKFTIVCATPSINPSEIAPVPAARRGAPPVAAADPMPAPATVEAMTYLVLLPFKIADAAPPIAPIIPPATMYNWRRQKSRSADHRFPTPSARIFT